MEQAQMNWKISDYTKFSAAGCVNGFNIHTFKKVSKNRETWYIFHDMDNKLLTSYVCNDEQLVQMDINDDYFKQGLSSLTGSRWGLISYENWGNLVL